MVNVKLAFACIKCRLDYYFLSYQMERQIRVE